MQINKKVKSKALTLLIIFLLLPVLLLSATNYSEGQKEFGLVDPNNTRNIIGNTFITGNTIECVTKYYYKNKHNYYLPLSLNQLQSAQCVNDLKKNDNNYFIKYIDIDNNNSTFNSSSATIKFPTTYKKIAWAGLFWQGHINDYSYQYYNRGWHLSSDYTYQIENNYTNWSANKIQLKIGNDTYEEIEANEFDYFVDSRYINGSRKYGIEYSAYADITDKIKNLNITSDTNVTIANIVSTRGWEYSLGDYGAWTLVIVYKEDPNNKNSKLRNNSVYYGYKVISKGNPDTITVSNFLLPKHGKIDSQMAVFAGEGEYAYQPDGMSLDNNELGATNCTTNPNDPSCKTNIFDAKLSPSIERNPRLTNNNGIDIDIFDTSSIMTAKRDANPNATNYSSTIDLSSSWDEYFPSMISFTTELYKPRVCYYINNIKDDSNNTIFKDGQFISGAKIDPAKEYKFNLWISNMKKNSNDTDIEDAKNVQIYVNAPEFNYTLNSTQIKNIGDSAYSSITDQVGDDIGEYNSSTKNFTWRLGTGANANQGGNINVANGFDDNSSKAFIKLQGRFSNIEENQTSIDISNYYNFRASFQTDSITVAPSSALPIYACINMDTSTDIYKAPPGNFNVVHNGFTGTTDPLDPINSKNALYTQITNKPFYVKILALGTDNMTLKAYNGDINITIITTPHYNGDITHDKSVCKTAIKNSLFGFVKLNFQNTASKTQSFTYSSANKNLSFGIVYDDGGTFDYVCSRDNFSIRPANYSIDMNETKLIGGRTYKLDINATKYGTITNALGYTQTINNNSDKNATEQLDLPTTCTTLSGSKTPLNITFNNGVVQHNYTYPNIGDINITITDANWTNVDQRQKSDGSIDCIAGSNTMIPDVNGKIGCLVSSTKQFSFSPKMFRIALSIKNFDNGSFTYISNNKNMSASLKIKISAILDNNSTATNYTAKCFSKDINTTIKLISLPSSTEWLTNDGNATKRIIFFDDKNITTIKENNGTGWITLSSKEGNFTSGIADINATFNFKREINSTDEPFHIKKNDFNITINDTSNINGSDFNRTNDQNVTFFYGRVHAPDYSAENNTTISDAKIYYEVYCKDCNKSQYPSLGKESIDGVYWYINSAHNSINDGNISNFLNSLTYNTSNNLIFTPPKSPNNISNGIENHTITYNGNSYPYKENVDINASKWLIYNPYDKTAKYNSFNVEFYGVGGWAGVGDINQTVDLNISIKKSKRLEW